jgi:hypothetical protein
MTNDNSNPELRATIDEVVLELESIKSAADQALAFLGEIRDPADYDEPTPAPAAISLAWGDAAMITASIHEVLGGIAAVRRLLPRPPDGSEEVAEYEAFRSGPPYHVVMKVRRAA